MFVLALELIGKNGKATLDAIAIGCIIVVVLLLVMFLPIIVGPRTK
jgi:hypothetical protein